MEDPMWPVVDGRYKVGNRESPVAVCTMATVEMDLPMDKIAIKGKCVTENIGIEKIVQNIVTNPNIRYLIFCGKDSRGHFIRQAIEQLIKEGVEGPNKKIKGAMGAMPEVKNLTTEEVEAFRKQVTTVSLPDVTDAQEVMKAVEECYSKNPGPYKAEGRPAPERREVEEVAARRNEGKDWVQDPKGYFIIIPNKEKGAIVVEHHDGGGLRHRITGRDAEEIYHTIVRMGWVSRHEHAAYLGRELAKAELALKHGIEYEQEKPLNVLAACPKFVAREKPAPQAPAAPKPKEQELLDDGRSAISRTFLLAGKVTYTVTEKVKEDPEFERVRREAGLHRAF